MNKYIFKAVLSAAIIIGIAALLAGCPNGSTNDDDENTTTDTWSTPTSLNDLDGTWKGGDETETTLGEGIKIATKVVITMTIDADAKTQVRSQSMTQTYSGGNIDLMWDMLQSSLQKQAEENPDSEYTFGDHSVTIKQDIPIEAIPASEIPGMLSNCKINQTKTKLKTPGGFGEGSSEIIFTKQES